VLSSVDPTTGPDFTITAVDCPADHHRGRPDVLPRQDVRLVLMRNGGLRRPGRGGCARLDPAVGYLGMPGEEERFARPTGDDRCTSISLAPAFWRALAGDAPRPSGTLLYVDGRLDLAHRQLLAVTRTADVDHAAAQRLAELVTGVVRQVVATTTPDGGRAGAGDRTLVARARGVIGDAHPAASGLVPLAALLGVSPYRLSRAFTRELGVSLTRYRNRVRVAHALDRIEEGEPSLAVLASDLGFADQAHLSRTVREHSGHTPTALRDLLARGRGRGGRCGLTRPRW